MATTQSDIEQEIEEAAGYAQTVSIDGTQTTEHSLPDKIAADKYVRANRGMRRGGCGVVFRKISPPGAV